MDTKFITLSEILDLFKDEVRAKNSPEKAQRIINELESGINRFLLPQLGFQRLDSGRKMTATDTQAATEFTKTVTVLRLRKARELVANTLAQPDITLATRNTYGGRLNQFLSWVEQQSWYPSERMIRIQHQCRLPRGLTGRRRVQNLQLTEREGPYLEYSLKPGETSPALQEALNDLERFMVAPNYPGRVRPRIQESTSTSYLKDIRLILGYCVRYQPNPIPLTELTLAHLIPLVTRQDLAGLSELEREDLWRTKELQLEEWINNYFAFIQEHNCSISPHTRLGKLAALQRVGYYLYRHQVRRNQDYKTIPILIALEERIKEVLIVKKKWDRTRTYVADQKGKWLDPVPGETVLTTARREILEPMRIASRPRRHDGTFCEPDVIARDILHYLKWALILDLPPRRQQAYRTTQIALTCPVQRPVDVPTNGYIFPLPPQDARQKDVDGMLSDNYLYKVYSDEGVVYPEGQWILELRAFKTDDVYGTYRMKIPNRTFEDGTQFYDYLEHYLWGWWMPGGRKRQQAYDWWDPTYTGRRGRWITKGRLEFEPQDEPANSHRRTASIWRSGYLFPVPKTGQLADGSSFGGSFKRGSYQLVGKNITPHIVRAYWATWAFQVGLSDAELRSLAYAMGHSVATLRAIYERCTPEEKLRPIFEAIDRHLFQQLEEPPEDFSSSQGGTQPRIVALVKEIQQLSPEERAQVLKEIEESA